MWFSHEVSAFATPFVLYFACPLETWNKTHDLETGALVFFDFMVMTRTAVMDLYNA